MDASGLRFTLSVGGLPPETLVVSGFTLHEQFSTPFTLELEAASANPNIEFRSILDNNATLTIWRETEVQRIVNGIVTSIEQGDTGLHQTRYRLTVRPAFWRAGLGRNSRIFQQQSFLNIMETLMQENNISDYAHAFRDTHAEREFCVQYNESDLDFINRMAAEEGIFYFFEHENGKHTLVFADTPLAVHDGPTLPYYPNKQQTSLDEPCVTTFKRRESLRPSEVLLKDYTFKNPRWEATSYDYARDMEHQTSQYHHYDYPGRFKSGNTGDDFTRWRVQALRNDAHQGEGASNCPILRPGLRFTLENHPLDALNTRWQITQVIHTGDQPQALESDSGGLGTTLVSQFAFIPNNQTWRPLSLPKPRIDGAQIAIVTGPPSEEIFCDDHGRVKVHFLWDISGETDDRSSCWIRVAHPWAGQGWGMSAIPRIGHEVIVEFLNGDPDQPVIIGRTYHACNFPPGRLPGTKTQMSIRSQTHKGNGFNELRFEDEKGKEEIYIHAQQDLKTEVLRDKTEGIDHDENRRIGNDRKQHIVHNDFLQVSGEKRDRIESDYSLTVNNNYHIKTNNSLLVEAEQEIHFKSGNKIVIETGTEITLKVGSNFVKIDPSGITISPTLNVGAGSPSTGRGWGGKMPDVIPIPESVPAFRVNAAQVDAFKKPQPFCEECERCKQEQGCAI
ncbi:type VI secretion system tip protein VgrG [Pectobacterium parmentieri]|uniref:type VI secretion system Vgr family protein n=2 Tax=Pectobacterium parmentieri TaxID=1905730 RepID=UPI000EB30BFD|nr:type VI secretion system tip protein VgrG [Pectobacterium parmentieri]AYH01037.1 type VI secretion system tip protein VgrG [Pectobacterium parmentieri]AYH27308.1 type VI secretion system tip protein VgrG [Pectobacterium parmentieri]AYH31614.1 type VI secretion system tip protein VgrG [Pectobacterium parmentieri]MBI0516738.1 type VI secretion system tip protein VgrG [Pectobacterium parmentieri]